MSHEQRQNSLSLTYAEALLVDYLADPESVPEDWRGYFRDLARAGELPRELRIGPSFEPSELFRTNGRPATVAGQRRIPHARLQNRLDELVRTFRIRGHLAAHLDPLSAPPARPELEPSSFGISRADLQKPVSTENIPGPDVQTVGQVRERMVNTYCRSIGVEYMHISDLEVRRWIQERIEVSENRATLNREAQLRILKRLTDATVFETFIQKKYLGAKSFSLEGAESLLPLLELAIEKAGSQGTVEIVFGMAHRGRLNVLCNILGKSPHQIFEEFEDSHPEDYRGRGDVKYHLGHSSDWATADGGRVHLSLAFNPSHLEFIGPVAMGRIRAKQDRIDDAERRKGMVLLIHGDAAFAGEGVVQETLNLSELPAYSVGGTVHVILNNQIGFTTLAHQARSNSYATDIAKMLKVPIFHVNGEDPEAVAQVVDVALDFRHEFARDVVIDMYCYRRRGHNEGDEPAFTQPVLYKNIRERRPVWSRYVEHLLGLGGIQREEADQLLAQEEAELEAELERARQSQEKSKPQAYEGVWKSYRGGPEAKASDPDTGVPAHHLALLLETLATVPDDFRTHPKIERVLAARREMARAERPLDWAAAEALALASVAVVEHNRVRMTGQDCERGTFSHRHAVLHDVEDGRVYESFRHLAADQAPVDIWNSPLSEAGVLGFEYGYSLDCPDGLVIWEAQFGDFCNAAQVVIDQFMTSAEDKWNRLSGIVLLLPHGFEGQGPEHSSARLERWLTLAAEDNIQVVYPTTPAQFFHCLRRQVVRPLRKPLVVLTPKSLLRNAAVVSPIEDLAAGTFQRVIAGSGGDAKPGKKTKRVLLCSGKIFYELDQRRQERGGDDVAIVRLEQLYPLPNSELEATLAVCPKNTEVTWVQEEPVNMGAARYLRFHLGERLFGRQRLKIVARSESASPATGSARSHKIEQEQLVDRAFADL